MLLVPAASRAQEPPSPEPAVAGGGGGSLRGLAAGEKAKVAQLIRKIVEQGQQLQALQERRAEEVGARRRQAGPGAHPFIATKPWDLPLLCAGEAYGGSAGPAAAAPGAERGPGAGQYQVRPQGLPAVTNLRTAQSGPHAASCCVRSTACCGVQ